MTIAKEQEKNKKLNQGGFDKRRLEVASMNAIEVRKMLKSLKVNEWTGDDSGLLKAKTFHLLGLGEPPRKLWSKTSAIFMLDKRGYVYEDTEINTKKGAVATLTKVRESTNNDDDDNDTRDLVIVGMKSQLVSGARTADGGGLSLLVTNATYGLPSGHRLRIAG